VQTPRRRDVTNALAMVPPRPRPRLRALDDGGVGHAAALAHRLQREASVTLFERVDHGRHDAGAAGTEGVADGDRAAVDVGLRQVGSGVTSPRQNDRAFGWDGITALFDGLDSIREVIAFPKSGGGVDPLTDAPAPITAQQERSRE
jgi:hypothetical protein